MNYKYIYIYAKMRQQSADLSQQFVVTAQKLEEQLQKTGGADQIFISQEDEGFTKCLGDKANRFKTFP